ncbi:hypothetical protein BDK51DRAFT_30832 [Blyttiomyces helicus]|uniref:Uncharacterized protein n=1 Tax=Blyttiomyces helicus TaxID=388810 RepID=A0A4P9WFB7_9FUNG|nr:hypothetical protein BDK51DRAFT_30832 [Blyttiomyces helicus]|eukprot:RKO91102.1 hypothetical protein BDK51DRAFT_30832 [Blyttiomyces helicus]
MTPICNVSPQRASCTQQVAKAIVDHVQLDTNNILSRLDHIVNKIQSDPHQVVNSVNYHLARIDPQCNRLEKTVDAGQLRAEAHILDTDDNVRALGDQVQIIAQDSAPIRDDLFFVLNNLTVLEQILNARDRSFKRGFKEIKANRLAESSRIIQLSKSVKDLHQVHGNLCKAERNQRRSCEVPIRHVADGLRKSICPSEPSCVPQLIQKRI